MFSICIFHFRWQYFRYKIFTLELRQNVLVCCGKFFLQINGNILTGFWFERQIKLIKVSHWFKVGICRANLSATFFWPNSKTNPLLILPKYLSYGQKLAQEFRIDKFICQIFLLNCVEWINHCHLTNWILLLRLFVSIYL